MSKQIINHFVLFSWIGKGKCIFAWIGRGCDAADLDKPKSEDENKEMLGSSEFCC